MSGAGFVDVLTQPAGAHSTSVPGLGTFYASPTIGSDGTVYLGTLEGKVIALHADGTPYWDRELPPASSCALIMLDIFALADVNNTCQPFGSSSAGNYCRFCW